MLTPSEIRDANWQQIAAHLSGRRAQVHAALLNHGPATTRGLAIAMHSTELSVRPRVCELVQLGFARVVGVEGREGVYEAIQLDKAETAFIRSRSAGAQTLMPI